MGIIRDIQRSRPLQVLISVIGLIFFYYFVVRSSSSPSVEKDVDSSYTNEELNSILRGDTRSELNEFNIRKQELDSLALKSPLLSTTTLELFNYNNHGNALLSNDKIRLISDKPHQSGSIFSRKTIPGEYSFEMELEFSLNGHAVKNGLYGDGLAIWLTDEPLQGGETFGVENKWNGLGLFIDTYQNNLDKSHRSKGFPYASLQLNDGKFGMYDKDTDGVKSETAGCSLSRVYNVRSGKSRMRLIYLRDSGYLSVDFDLRSNGNWKNCFTIDNDVKLPPLTYVGFSGATGELSHNVDLFKFEIYGLFDDEDNPIKSIQLINEDLKHHMKEEETSQEEIGDVVQPTERTNVIKRQKNARNRHNRRRTLTRLHKLEKRLKLKIREENKLKYNGHESFISYLWSIIKLIFFWIFVLIAVYIVTVIVRSYLARKRVARSNYYRGGLL